MEEVSAHQAKAACDLYRVLSEKKDGNVFLSPFSISTALSMVYCGAAGNSAAQMKTALSLPEVEKAEQGYGEILKALQKCTRVTLDVANRMYVQNSIAILESYQDTLEKNFLAKIQGVNFGDSKGTCDTINSEIEKITRGKIRNLVDESAVGPSTALILINAIYFKGNWKEPFKKSATKKRDFHVSENEVVKTDMMHLDNTQFNCAKVEELDCQVLEMPYEERRFSMIILLPNQKRGLQSLRVLEEKVFEKGFTFIRSKIYCQEPRISMPKFKFETTYDLIPPLQKLGITDIFGNANLSKITGAPSLYVSRVLHRAVVEVNEEGTEAVAATMVQADCVVSESRRPFFVCDHPFMFAIFDRRTNMVLFSGRYVRPEEEK